METATTPWQPLSRSSQKRPNNADYCQTSHTDHTESANKNSTGTSSRYTRARLGRVAPTCTRTSRLRRDSKRIGWSFFLLTWWNTKTQRKWKYCYGLISVLVKQFLSQATSRQWYKGIIKQASAMKFKSFHHHYEIERCTCICRSS
jgi:hypothetical protein